MRFRCLAISSLLLSLIAASTAAPVQTETGVVEGATQSGVAVYKAVPFAAPPMGDLRWRDPQPVQPWPGVRRSEFAPACMQKGVSMPGEQPPATSEDCLYLNIWAPAGSTSRRLPVLVWIYGGGFSNGSASMPLYWGDQLARKGLLVVTVSYRVGAFGFLAHPELSRESPRQSSGNYGLMDQIAALKWVQRNIAAFGGDAAQVTIAGQSAGSSSVSILMASPLTKGLFHRAIGQSGGFFEPVQLAPSYLLRNAEREGVAVATSLGAPTIQALRSLPAETILNARLPSGPHPVLEPHVLPEMPFDTFAGGRQAHVPLMLGSNAEEARAFLDPGNVTAANFADGITKTFGPLPPPLINAYPHATDEQARSARIAFETDLRFGWNMWAWAKIHATTGRNKVFYYRFSQRPPFPENSPHANWGPSHYAELWYMFGKLNNHSWRWTSADRRLETAMLQYWANFVKSGNPNGSSLPEWPAFAGPEGPMMNLGETVTPGPVPGLAPLQVFDAVYNQLRKAPLQ